MAAINPRSDYCLNHEDAEPLAIHMAGSEWFSAQRGGLNRYFSDLFAALRGRSDVELSGAAFGEPEPGGSSWGPLGGSTRSRVRASMRASDIPDTAVLDRHFALYGPSRRRQQSLVTHFHGPWAAESAAAGQRARATRAKYLFERARYHGSDLYIVLAAHFAGVLTDQYGADPERIAIIPPGVDLDRFQASAIPDAAPVVLCVRRLERRMGIDVLIDSWPAIRAEVPDASLVIVGSGTIEADLRAQARDAGLSSSVQFMGEVSDDKLTELYSRCAITVIPTRSLEGFGLIALESLASGRAPVLTDVGGLPESVRGFDDSLIVPAEDAHELAARVIAALNGKRPSPSECRGQADRFSWSECADRHVAAYRAISR